MAQKRDTSNKQLKKKLEPLSEIFRHTPGAIVVEDLSGQIIYLNPDAEHLYGSRLVGQHIGTIVPPDFRRQLGTVAE